jgi:outer membrane murein-binding lipoprotein Lpp
MAALDDEIDAINKQIETAAQETQRAKAEYDSYLATVKI